MRTSIAIGLVTLAAMAGLVQADSRQTVHFAKGAATATVDGTVKGRDVRDYVLGAKAGQTMSVKLASKSTLYFNVLAPGSDGEALFNSSMSADGNAWSGKLPKDGDWVVRVYAMGADKHGGGTHAFTCTFSIQ